MGDLLDRLASLAAEVGDRTVENDARDLSRRLDAGRLFLASVGQFKRGKSTLLNALVGESVLPTGVLPVTSVVTVLRHGTRATASVTYEHGTVEAIPPAAVADYVTEERNPGNTKGVRLVEIALSAELLRHGICLVDTPGIGSVFGANTLVTRQFVPHVDAALVVLGADPPIAAEEVALVSEVAKETPEIIVVLGKADRVPPDQQTEACEFARRILAERVGLSVERIYVVSATQVLAGAPDRDWYALLDRLRTLTPTRDRLLAARVARRVAVMRTQLIAIVREREDALNRPIAESDARIAGLRSAVGQAQQSVADLSALLASEQGRVLEVLEREKAAFLDRSIEGTRADLDLRLATLRSADSVEAREAAIDVARTAIARWGTDIERNAAALCERSMLRFAELADQFLTRLAESADPAFSRMPRTAGIDLRLEETVHFYFTEMLTVAPEPSLASRLLPASVRRANGRRAAEAYLERLLVTNASRFVNDLIDRVRDSRRRLEAEVRRVLESVIDQAEGAIALARVVQAAGARRVALELERLQRIRGELDVLGRETEKTRS